MISPALWNAEPVLIALVDYRLQIAARAFEGDLQHARARKIA
jgi:hypothetical protein